MIKTAKTRKVRTAEGAEWYGQPIGAVIRAKDRRSDDGQQGRTEGDRRASGEVSPAVPGPGVDGRRDSGVRGAGLLKAKGFTVKQRLPDTPRTQQLKERGNNTDPLFEVDAAADKGRFRQAMMDSLKDNPYAASVYVYPEDDYGEMRLFLTADGLAGIALHGDEIVSAFSSHGRGIGPHLVSQGVAQGGRRLDAFDTVLPKIYASEGFTTAARLKWDDNYAPDAWDKNVFRRFNNGEPDVVFMFYSAALDRAYSPSEGAYVSDYDAGLAATKERAKEKMIRRFKGLSKAERRVKTPEGAKWYGQPIGSVIKPDASYRMQHQGPDPDYGGAMHDVEMFFPDIHGPDGARLYAHGYGPMYEDGVRIIQRMKDRPDAMVTIYRAVPKDVDRINPGDWVTTVRGYATEHGRRGMDDYRVVKLNVTARELFTDGNSVLEWAWHPKRKVSKSDPSPAAIRLGDGFLFKGRTHG